MFALFRGGRQATMLLWLLLATANFIQNSSSLDSQDSFIDDVGIITTDHQHDSTNQKRNEGLCWKELSVITSKGKTLLHPSSGFIPNGHFCALLGPSGSGKSSFLSAIGGRSQHEVRGHVWYSSTKSTTTTDREECDDLIVLSPDPSQVAWISQVDSFFSMLTPRETLRLASFLERPQWNDEEREDLVRMQLESLGLLSVADNRIGADDDSAVSFLDTSGHERLSGGEKRRLTVALELLTHELFLLADEPTSGLDSRLSVTVSNLIRLQAKQRNITALCSLHQPRSSLWHNSIDSVILLAPGGRVCYCGNREDCLPYFDQLGFQCPELTNPAEFLVDLVSLGDPRDGDLQKDNERIDFLAKAFKTHQYKTWKDPRFVTKYLENQGIIDQQTSLQSSSHLSIKSYLRQLSWNVKLSCAKFGALFRRSWRQNIRSRALHLFRFLASVGNAVLLAKIFPTVNALPPLPNSVADRIALLSFGAINMAFMAFMKAVVIFSDEQPVIHREQTRQQYSAMTYLAGKVLAELPSDCFFAAIFTTVLKWSSGLCITWAKLTGTFSLMTVASASLGFLISSWSPPSGSLATTASVPILVVLMVVGIINPSGVDPNLPPPALVQALKSISPFRFAIEALCLGEYPGMEFCKEKRTRWFRRVLDLPKMGALSMVQNGEQVIKALGLQHQTYLNAMKQLVKLSVVFLGLSWLGLESQQFWSRRTPPNQKKETAVNDKVIEDATAFDIEVTVEQLPFSEEISTCLSTFHENG